MRNFEVAGLSDMFVNDEIPNLIECDEFDMEKAEIFESDFVDEDPLVLISSTVSKQVRSTRFSHGLDWS
jgi:hypothetical protein